MSILLSLLIASAAAATGFNLKVESPKLNYTVSVSEKQFLYRSGAKKIQQKISPCSKRAYEVFTKKIRHQIQKDYAKSKIKIPNTIHVKMNNESFFLPPLSTSGNFMSKMDTDVDYLMSEAIYRCSKK